MSRKSVLQECLSQNSAPQELLTRVTHKSVLQECRLGIWNVFAFGFVGSILFFTRTLFGEDKLAVVQQRKAFVQFHQLAKDHGPKVLETSKSNNCT